MIKCNVIPILLGFSFLLVSCNTNPEENILKLGNQSWAANNLNVASFRNGDVIQEARTNKEWENAGSEGKPAWCYYGNNRQNEKIYGKLYNWFAVSDPRGLAPEGWHVPAVAEWTQLITFLGGESNAAIKLKSTSGWEDIGNGTNCSGFSALPGGWRSSTGEFKGIRGNGTWWSSTEFSRSNAWYMSLEYINNVTIIGSDSGKENGVFVRCIRN
jgi:uncharacterized protein (TIGR02145 family)